MRFVCSGDWITVSSNFHSCHWEYRFHYSRFDKCKVSRRCPWWKHFRGIFPPLFIPEKNSFLSCSTRWWWSSSLPWLWGCLVFTHCLKKFLSLKKRIEKLMFCRISIQQSPYLMKMNTLPSKIAFCYFSIRKQIFCKSSFISI